MSTLAALLQRLPALSHLFILFLAVYGPTYSPVILATILFGIHIVLLINNVLSVYGQYCAWRGVEDSLLPKRYKDNDIEHIIIVPAYKEDLETLRETLDVLGSHTQARDRYRICLAMEEREQGSEKKALQLQMEYEEVFAEIDHSQHPVIIGEAAGKSSNVNWGARYMATKFDALERSKQVITVIDSDTCLSQDYFQMVAEKFTNATPSMRSKMMFCIPIIFDRNAHQVPVFVRLTDIMWAQAGFSTTYPSSDIKIPTSAYGISMELAAQVGFWDTGPDAIGEDMHMFVKSFLSTGGNLHVETIYSPASQLNVVGDKHSQGGFAGWVSDMRARYAQGMRHMWGSLDSGYALRRVITGDLGDGPVNWWAMTNLLFRLFQAHIMLGWLLILLLRDQISPLDPYKAIRNAEPSETPEIIAWDIAWISFCVKMVDIIRGFSVISTIATMLLYDKYHHAAAVKRWNKPQAGMRANEISLRRFPWSLLDLCAIPGGILFGIVPLYHAQFLHLFTNTLTYTVSLKAKKVAAAVPIKVALSKLAPNSDESEEDDSVDAISLRSAASKLSRTSSRASSSKTMVEREPREPSHNGSGNGKERDD